MGVLELAPNLFFRLRFSFKLVGSSADRYALYMVVSVHSPIVWQIMEGVGHKSDGSAGRLVDNYRQSQVLNPGLSLVSTKC